MNFDPRFQPPFGPQRPFWLPPAGGSQPQPTPVQEPNEEDEQKVPRFEVVKHPSAPAQLPFAIRDNASGRYVTGSSPLFPRVFATPAEAHQAIQEHAQSAQLHPGFPTFGGSQPVSLDRDTTALPSRGTSQNARATPPAPAATAANRGGGGPAPGASNGLLASRGPGSVNAPRPSSNNTAASPTHPPAAASVTATNTGAKPTNRGVDPAHPSTTSNNSRFAQFVSAYVSSGFENNPMAALSTYSQIGTYSKLQTAADQETLAGVEQQIQNLKAADKPVSQHLLNQQARSRARVAMDPLIGTMPGNTPGLWNCAVGTQQFLYAHGMPWDKIPHTESAGGMRSLVSSRQHDWQQVSHEKLQVGDLIFIPEPVKNHQGSGWHVCVYVGPGDLAIQADSGGHRGVKNYIRLAKYLRFDSGMKEHGDEVEYYHYTGAMDPHPHDVTKNAPWKNAKGKDKGNWQGYQADSL